jgi:MFS transporter, AAHS family, 4-hydroxybenzoate transporter
METPVKINISDLVDNSRFGAFQLGILILCGLCLIMDGFDLQAMGYVAPALLQDWKIPKPELGPVFGAALLGVLVGSLLLSMLADRIGRRPVLIGATLFFAAVTLMTAQVSSLRELLALRFIAGIGLGGIMPNAMALVGEYSSRRTRVALMMIVLNGFTTGAALGGFISAWLIPAFGWRSVFKFGGAVPLAIAALMFFALPESLQFLALRGRDHDQIGKWLKRIDPAFAAGPAEYLVREEKRKGVPVVQLFHDGRATGTVLLWTTNFMNLLNLYFLASWLPTVVKEAGFSTSKAVIAGAMLQVGGTVGAFGLGWVIARLGFSAVLTSCFAVASASIALIGQPSLSLALLFLVVFVAGLGVVGGQCGVNALAATYYPTDLRSTGIGSGLGVGRIGAIVGPVLAGELMSLQWSSYKLFMAAAVPALISALMMFAMRWVMEPEPLDDVEREVAVG